MSEREKRMLSIEGKYFGPCIDQVMTSNHRCLVELFYMRTKGGEGGQNIIVVKDYEAPIPRSGSSSKPWPTMRGARIFTEIDAGGTWESMEDTIQKMVRP